MSEFLNYTINGALIGLLYALIAMGFIVIYRASKVFNFAQGELVVFGGFVVWWMITSIRSEEHTSELQSLMRISYAVFCLKTKIIKEHTLLLTSAIDTPNTSTYTDQ